MKIGFKPKSYNDVVCFDLGDNGIKADDFINALFSTISADTEDNLDFVVTVSKKSKANKDKKQINQEGENENIQNEN